MKNARRKSKDAADPVRSDPGGGESPRRLKMPVFAQPEPTADPQTFRIKHASDAEAYHEIDELNKKHLLSALPFPPPRGGIEPRLTLAQVLGDDEATVRLLEERGRIVFHATGDCGSTKGPTTQNLVTDKMISDFDEAHPAEVPQFNLLLGDVVYSFGESQYYYDQFYEPYRNYRAPILAAAGNHDGMVAPHGQTRSLDAYLRNFCADRFFVTPDAGGLSRTAQIQPGVFFTFEAPFVRVLVLYSNALEDPGVLANPKIGDSQLKFVEAALKRVKAERYPGALLLADHHPPFTAGQSRHGWSAELLAQLDQLCESVGVWPHAMLSGHAHSYQRFTRTRKDGSEIPYVVCGNGGHNVQSLTRDGPPLRTPQIVQPASGKMDQVVFQNYDDQDYGYLRVVATAKQLRIEYHPASDGAAAKTPDDQVTVDLASRRLGNYAAHDLGRPEAGRMVRTLRKKHGNRPFRPKWNILG